MDVLLELNLKNGDFYYALKDSHTISGNQYLAGIIQSLNAKPSMSLEGGYESSSISFSLIDVNDEIKQAYNQFSPLNQFASVYIYEGGAKTLILKCKIYKYGMDKYPIIKVHAESQRQNFDENALLIINSLDYPNAAVEDEVISVAVGDYNTGIGTISARRVNFDSDKVFLYNSFPTNGTAIYPGTALKVFEGETDVTASVTLYQDTVIINGVSFYRKFLKYPAATEDILTCTHQTAIPILPSDILERWALYINIDYSSTWQSTLDNVLEKRLFWVNKQTSPPTSPQPLDNYISFGYDSAMKARDIFRDAWLTYLIFYRFQQANEIDFTIIDYSNLTPKLKIREMYPLTTNLNWSVDGRETENNILHKYNRSNPGGRLTKQRTWSMPDKDLSIRKYGEHPAEQNQEWITSRLQARIAAKHWAILFSEPENMCDISYKFETASQICYPGDIIEVENRKLIDERRLFVILNNEIDPVEEFNTAQMLDITHLEQLDINAKLVLHSYEKDTENFWNDAPDSDSEILSFGNVQHIESGKSVIFGNVIQFNGTDQYLKIADPTGIDDQYRLQAKKFNILSYDSYSISFWVSIVPNSNIEGIIAIQNTTTNDRIDIVKLTDNRIATNIIDGVTPQTIVGMGTTAISDSNAHHYHFVKLNNEFALYLDGIQVAYRTSSSTYDILGDVFIGRRGFGGNWFNGTIEELRMGSGNIFDAAPNAALTDVIAGYNSQFTWTGLKQDETKGFFWVDENGTPFVDENGDIFVL